MNRTKIEKCVLLFTANTNILILLYRELKTDGKSFISAVCRLPFAVMHQSIETPTPWVPGKGRGFDSDPGQKASISLLPEAGVQIKRPYP